MSTETTLTDDLPVDPDDELLVAYLDGELETAERNDLEERLLNEENLRVRLQKLQSGWDMLDDLPSPGFNEKLVESTLELVVADVTSLLPTAPKKSFFERFQMPIFAIFTSLLAAAAGYWVVDQSRRQAEQRQLADLGVAENIDAYLSVSDLSLMRDLSATPNWNLMIRTAREFGGFRADVANTVQAAPLSQRADVVTKMPAEERSSLESRWDRFQSLSTTDKERARDMAASVAAQSDPDLLLKTMADFAVWQETLPNDLRDAINNSDADNRFKAFEDAIDFTQSEISRQSGKTLDEPVVEIIHAYLRFLLDKRISENPRLGESINSMLQRMDSERVYSMNLWQMVTGHFANENSPPLITSEELRALGGVLNENSESASDALNLLSNWTLYRGRDPLLEGITLRAWAQEALRRKSDFNRDKSTMLDRYLEVDGNRRDSMDMRSPEEIKRMLSSRGRMGGPPSRRGSSGFGGGRGGPPPSPRSR